jgi:hypothetical protein
MKNLIPVLSFLLFCGPALFSQRVIEIKYETDPQGNYQFDCINHAYCNYILELNFTSLDNARANPILPFRAEVPGRGPARPE